jgi:AraC-like DNA-binding protein
MQAELIRTRIISSDVDDLSQVVAPWNFDLTQMTTGKFRADLKIASFNGILVSAERWSNSLISLGNSPPGYIALAGVLDGLPWLWNGFEINSTRLACGVDAPEFEITTRDGASHWTILIPLERLLGFIGEESGAVFSRLKYTLSCPAGYSRHFKNLICKLVDANQFLLPADQSPIVISSVEHEILSSVEALLAYAENDSKAMSIRRRYAIYRRALQFAETVDHRISVEEFADALEVSMRVLQLSFRENIGITPRRFLIQMRLNHLHHDLRRRGLDST